MSIGALAFLSPWLLAALATLPIIYWLLRTVPPRPQQIEFPPTRILVGLENKEKTPAKTPWWLLLIRLLAAALVILALAEPVLNPSREQVLKGTGPVVIAIDNGWSSAPRWQEHVAVAERLVGEAQAQNRPVVVLPTARAGTGAAEARIEAPSEALGRIASLTPQPFAPDRAAALAALISALGPDPKEPATVWLTDGIDHDGAARAFADGLAALSGSATSAAVDDANGAEALGLSAALAAGGRLTARVVRAAGPARDGVIHAFSARGQRLGETRFSLADGEVSRDVAFDLPLELRNQVTRLEIAGERSAGAVHLLDARSQWQRVGLISGESQEQSQPLLAPLYYIEKAIQPFAEIIRTRDQNLDQGVDTVLAQNASVMVLADIGTLSGDVKARVEEWVKRGGVLVRFAGPRLEGGGDELLPVSLRLGGRTLGGALSWATPQPLAPFDDASLFAGLTVPPDVTINRQVLADPARLTPEVKVWARLGDGTPLVTAVPRGAGQIVLFHITANSDWSNLPISGLFVDMLQRITTLSANTTPDAAGKGAAAVAEPSDATRPAAAPTAPEELLAPVQTLDGFGRLGPPPPTAEAVSAAKALATLASAEHPPGYYGPSGTPRSINVIGPKTSLAPLPPLSDKTERRAVSEESARDLKPWLLAAAFALILADMAAVIALMAGGFAFGRRARRAAAVVAAISVAGGATMIGTPAAKAQDGPTSDAPRTTAGASAERDAIAQKATENVTLGYVLTGDVRTDQASKQGLSGLGRVLAVRTAVEPGEPIGVDIVNDEIAFYPVLYWPVLDSAEALPARTLAKIDAFMKQGGMIVFDTRDAGSGKPSGVRIGRDAGGKSGLQRLLGSLDVPRLEPVPVDHVLTKSFYLLRSFPGRWDAGDLWVEAGTETDETSRKARRSDGVSSILVTSNDFASAWALDASGRPLYPVVPGGEAQREQALRTGVNIVMHALTGNYKADQVHVPALLERLGQ